MVQRPPAGTIPDEPGSYQFKDADGRVIYVGKTASLRQRLSNYFQDPAGLHPRTAQMVATAQRSPNRRTDGTATWSLSTLQRALRRQSFPTLGTSTIRRVLQDAGSSYQRTRTWCPTGTAQRKRKAGVVTVVDPQTEVKRGSSNSPTTSRKP